MKGRPRHARLGAFSQEAAHEMYERLAAHFAMRKPRLSFVRDFGHSYVTHGEHHMNEIKLAEPGLHPGRTDDDHWETALHEFAHALFFHRAGELYAPHIGTLREEKAGAAFDRAMRDNEMHRPAFNRTEREVIKAAHSLIEMAPNIKQLTMKIGA